MSQFVATIHCDAYLPSVYSMPGDCSCTGLAAHGACIHRLIGRDVLRQRSQSDCQLESEHETSNTTRSVEHKQSIHNSTKKLIEMILTTQGLISDYPCLSKVNVTSCVPIVYGVTRRTPPPLLGHSYYRVGWYSDNLGDCVIFPVDVYDDFGS